MSEGKYSSLINKMTWSYSRLECFNTCRYKWFLEYIDDPLRIKSEPKFYSSFGSLVHQLIEEYYKGELKKEDMRVAYLARFSKEVRGERPPGDIVDKYIKAGYEYLKSFEPFPYNVVDVEKRVQFEIAGHKFIGFIDYLGEKDGEFYVVDNKSRDLKPRSKRKKPTLKDKELDDMLRQLYLYAGAIQQEYGKFPVKLCFNCFRNKTFIEEPFVEMRYTEAVEWATRTIEKIQRANDFYPNIDYFFCRYLCDYSRECCYVDRKGSSDESR